MRWVAGRRGLIVPSLVADVRQPEPELDATAAAEVTEVAAAAEAGTDLEPTPQEVA